MLECGVTILQPETVTIEHDVEVGRDSVIYPCTYLGAGNAHRQELRRRPLRLPENARVSDGERRDSSAKRKAEPPVRGRGPRLAQD